MSENLVFNVRDFGAVGDGVTNDTAAINRAIEACADAGGGRVVMDAGVFIVTGNRSDKSDGAIRLLSNVSLEGAGMGVTTLKVPDGWAGSITGVVRTPFDEVTTNVGLSGLTIDGNRDNTIGKIDGFYTGVRPGSTEQCADIIVSGVEILDCSGYGFDPHEQTIRLTIENSVSHGNGLDGFVADFIVDGIYRNNLAYDNDRHGFNVTTSSRNLLLENNIARDNGSAGLVVQRGSEAIPWPNGVTVSGGALYGNAREGAFVKLAEDVLITGVDIHGNARQGIRLDGASGTIVTGNQIHDNSQELAHGYAELLIQDFNDRTTGLIFGSVGTEVTGNDFYFTGPAPPSSNAIFEANDISSGTIIADNTIGAWPGGGVSLPDSYGVPVYGSEGADALVGGTGRDDLRGLAGDDTLTGAAGGDRLDGGDGRDMVSFENKSVAVTVNLETAVGSGGDAEGDVYLHIEDIGGGNGADVLTGDILGNLLLGRGGADTLSGGGGNDTLDGGFTGDQMAGGEGDDVYFVDHSMDTVIEAAEQGHDKVFATSNHTLAGGVEDLELTGSAVVNGYGNDLANRLIGNAAANTLKAFAGADTLDGGAGADSMDGGDGNDTYVVDAADDIVVEKSNNGLGGVDTVLSTISYTLGSQVENLVLISAIGLAGTGNTAANAITGSLGADTLTGAGGWDNFVLRKAATQGDVITDFGGNGASSGDTLRFEGFAAGAVLSSVGDLWTVTAAGESESFRLTGVNVLHVGDYTFV